MQTLSDEAVLLIDCSILAQVCLRPSLGWIVLAGTGAAIINLLSVGKVNTVDHKPYNARRHML
jgi:hypothetical protein